MLRALAPHSVAAEGAIPLGGGLLDAALACAHQSSKSGRDLLHAIVVAYEASLRIGTMLCPGEAAPSKDIGYATWQTFGASNSNRGRVADGRTPRSKARCK
ncbi:MmgE/PrpD family protein [Paraburkholderia heleia]|uniref:MmgE/PrpD family protein n=1 Tax=Paraburkholderia heleia TaxID=634127 RepID=UPI001FE23EC5|nr:MmgE/PrpD family protein [Paraburkholderia heleia]